jgi:hypothetical protein
MTLLGSLKSFVNRVSTPVTISCMERAPAWKDLDVGDEFFPLWELVLPENRDALERRDFAAIRARRGPDWSVEPPRHSRAMGD